MRCSRPSWRPRQKPPRMSLSRSTESTGLPNQGSKARSRYLKRSSWWSDVEGIDTRATPKPLTDSRSTEENESWRIQVRSLIGSTAAFPCESIVLPLYALTTNAARKCDEPTTCAFLPGLVERTRWDRIDPEPSLGRRSRRDRGQRMPDSDSSKNAEPPSPFIRIPRSPEEGPLRL